VTFRRLALSLAAAAAMSLPALAQAPRNLDGTVQTESQFVATRIYRALAGREPEPAVLAQIAADIEQGRMRQRVNAIVISPEFRSHMYGMTPDRILAQIYQGLLEHDPDASTAGWQRLITMSKYADVIAGIIATPEFKARLAPFAPVPAPAVPGVGMVASVVAVPPAVACQENVVEAIRRDLGGVVFIQFDAATATGETITGAAMDVNAGNRRLTYTCNPTATYKYDDGGRERQVPAGTEFANAVVRACQTDIRLKAQQELGMAQLSFQSAGLMAGGTASHLVRGQAIERMPSGAAGPIVKYNCEMDGTQVTSSSVHAG
jgi:hypothetical protein